STDPGRVPRGFQQPGKRHCAVCHAQKPDRCHHCSVCGRCVLHGPPLPLPQRMHRLPEPEVFLPAALPRPLLHQHPIFVAVFSVPELVRRLAEVGDAEASRGLAFWCSTAAVFTSWAVLAALAYPLGMFTLYHFRAVVRNSTTIEDMQHGEQHQSPYDTGWGQNLMQVFGAQLLLWLLPVRCQWLEPLGDGVTWRKNTGQVRPTAP
ncbi:unnamed protein product, partial [Prorocentrum cordatum]